VTSAGFPASTVASWSGLPLTFHRRQVGGVNCAIVNAPERGLTAALSKPLSTCSTAASSAGGRSQKAPAARWMLGTSPAGIPTARLSPAAPVGALNAVMIPPSSSTPARPTATTAAPSLPI
jgi:hypothetical protein